MNYQSNGRYQRPKGFKVKQALQLAVLLVICIWLLYQIKNSNNENKDLSLNVQVKLHKEQHALGLGRKGDTGGSIDRVDPKNEKINIHERREDLKEPKIEYKDSQNIEENGGKDQVDNLNKGVYKDGFKDPKKLVNGKENDENLKDTLVKGNDEDKGTKKIALKDDETSNVTVSFNDENGVPQDIKEEESRNADDEKGNKGDLEDLKTGVTTDGDEEKSKDFEDSRSIFVHQQLEEVNDKSTLQKDG
ncbi:hypothetical protein LguiA_020031 [Lonicera macranthoides]